MKDREQPVPEGDPETWTMRDLEDFGRIRLSCHFFMRDMLYSEIASVHGMRNVPDNPELAVEVGKKLCSTLLEPLHATFDHVSIRSAFRSAAVNDCGEKYLNVAGTKKNHARHVWDRLGDDDKKGEPLPSSFPGSWIIWRSDRRCRGRRWRGGSTTICLIPTWSSTATATRNSSMQHSIFDGMRRRFADR